MSWRNSLISLSWGRVFKSDHFHVRIDLEGSSLMKQRPVIPFFLNGGFSCLRMKVSYFLFIISFDLKSMILFCICVHIYILHFSLSFIVVVVPFSPLTNCTALCFFLNMPHK